MTRFLRTTDGLISERFIVRIGDIHDLDAEGRRWVDYGSGDGGSIAYADVQDVAEFLMDVDGVIGDPSFSEPTTRATAEKP